MPPERQQAPAQRAAVDSLIALALLRPDGTPAPPVAEAVTTRPALATTEVGESDEKADAPAPAQAGARAAERAFTSVAAIADLVLLAADSPLALLTGGALAAGEKRRIAEMGTPGRTGRRASRRSPQTPASSHRSTDGLHATAAGRRVAAPVGIRPVDRARRGVPRCTPPWSADHRGRVAAGAALAGAVPLGSDLGTAERRDLRQSRTAGPDRARTDHRARPHGTEPDGTEPEWAVPLRRGDPADATALSQLLPAEVDRIFLQNDLTAIAPGPLEPALDVRLRSIAARESAAQASS